MSGSAKGPASQELQRRHAKSVAYFREASRYIAGGVNSNVRLNGRPVPLCFRSASGARLTDIDGNEYIDYAAGMGPTLLGHANEKLVRAVADSLTLGQLFAGQSELELELAKRLQAIVPCAGLLRLGMSGSEMVQAAIRVARSYTNRRKCIKFEGHYHGWFDNVLINLTSEPRATAPGGSIELKLETQGQVPSVLDDVAVLPWNDLSALGSYLEVHGEEIACVLMEPVMCNSGVIPPAAGYLEKVRALCDRYGIVFIMDEVITGFRLGIDGAQGIYNVTPDIATYAKAFGGGFPVAAMAGRQSIMSQIGSGSVNHSGTYNANLVSLAAGIATLDALEEDDGAVYKRIEAAGQALIDGIRDIGQESNVPLHVQGFPSVFSTYFSDQAPITNYAQLKRCDNKLLGSFLASLQDAGIRPTSRGTWFVTAAHDDDTVSRTLESVRGVVRSL